jgi:hypothetical protein
VCAARRGWVIGMRALVVVAASFAALLVARGEAAAWVNGLEPGSKIEVTGASATDGNVRRIWAIDDGNVVSRLDVALSAGGGDWTDHGHGGSPTMPHGVAATSYVVGAQNFEHVFYVGQDWNLYVGTSIDRGPVTWQVYARPTGVTFNGHIAATSVLSGGVRYLIAVTTNGLGTMFRWGRLASGGTATWASNASVSWIGQSGFAVSRNPAQTIISFFTEHTPSNRSVGMMRWNPSTGWTVTNLGHPTGVSCAPAAATENAFSTIVAGYRLSVACTNTSSTLFIASATSDTSTAFTWSSVAMPAPLVSPFGLAGTTRSSGVMSIVHEMFGATTFGTMTRIGIGSSSTTAVDMGPPRDVDQITGGVAVAPRSGSSRVFYVARMTDGYRMFERRGVTTSNAPADYRWLGSKYTNQFWIAPPQGAEAKIAAWRGAEAMGVMYRPGTGGPSEFPGVFLTWSNNQNEVLDPSRSKEVTKTVNIPGVGNVVHDYVGDPTVVMTQFKQAFSVQLGQVMASCQPGSLISRSTVYMVSTTDGITHSAPIVVETKALPPGSSSPAIDHPWADIEHRPFDTFADDVIHIVWWDVVDSAIRYVQWFQSSGGFGPKQTLRVGSAGPPRITVSDTGRVVVYYGVPGGQAEMCELNAARNACTTPPGSVGGWTPFSSYFYLHNVPVVGGGSIRSWYPVSAALSESDSNQLHFCVEVRETDGSDGDVKCGRVTRAADGSWSVASSAIVNAVADDDKDQFLPEVAVTSEDDGFTTQDTVFATWYDRANSPTNATFQVMKTASTDSDPQYLPRHCRDSTTRFLGDYAAVEGDLLHKNMPFVVVQPGTAIKTWLFSFNMGLGSWGD